MNSVQGDARSTVRYVTIDRPQDIDLRRHNPNVAGLQASASAVDDSLAVTVVTLEQLASLDAAGLDATYRPLAIFGAGSWSEWFHYADDDAWRAKLDAYMAIIRTTTIRCSRSAEVISSCPRRSTAGRSSLT